MSGFKLFNSNQPLPSGTDLTTGFVFKAPNSTDVWAKPPSAIAFNAPILYKTCPLSSFQRARVHVVANWRTLYDQGGLILVLNYPNGTQKWIKTGLEFVNNKPHVGTVVKDSWADWSLLANPSEGQAATVELSREADGSLWVYWVGGIQRYPIREVTWAFQDEKDVECWVGVYAAQPSKEGKDLEVTFKQLEIDIKA